MLLLLYYIITVQTFLFSVCMHYDILNNPLFLVTSGNNKFNSQYSSRWCLPSSNPGSSRREQRGSLGISPTGTPSSPRAAGGNPRELTTGSGDVLRDSSWCPASDMAPTRTQGTSCPTVSLNSSFTTYQISNFCWCRTRNTQQRLPMMSAPRRGKISSSEHNSLTSKSPTGKQNWDPKKIIKFIKLFFIYQNCLVLFMS